MTQTVIQQAILATIALLLIVSAVRFLRRRSLTFSSGLLWLSMGSLGLVGALLLPSVNAIGALVGVLPAAVFAGFASVLLGVIAFLLSVQVSRLEHSLQNTVEWYGVSGVDPPLTPAESSSILAIVPAYNEVNSVGAVVSDLRELGLPTLVIDDGSSDGTAAAARAAGGSVLRLSTNLGVGAALRAAMRYARQQGFTAVLQCDGDGQHPPDAVSALLEERDDRIDLLIGSRFTAGFSDVKGIARRSAIKALSRIASQAVGTRVSDSTSGLRIIQGPLLDELAERMERHYLGDTFEIVFAAGKAGYEVAEIPVTMRERRHGSSTASQATAVRMTLRALITAALRIHHPFARATGHERSG